jgi:hypothetical protein
MPSLKVLVRLASVLAALATMPSGAPDATAAEAGSSDQLRAQFEFLSQNGNSNCSRKFMNSIRWMPAGARLQGSCCSPMEFHRYGEQIEGLKAFAEIDVVPRDPYDIPAPLAAKLMTFYDIALGSVQQAAYDYAMKHSNEGGPCCCQCWRWVVYGGLAKHLIRDRGFAGEQIAELWDLSDGCGGEKHVGH